MHFDIVGLESPCVDLNINVENFPTPDGGERVLESSWQGGGKVATGMIAAARLHAKGAFIGTVEHSMGSSAEETLKHMESIPAI